MILKGWKKRGERIERDCKKRKIQSRRVIRTPIVMHNNNSSNKETKKISASAHSLSSYSAPFFLKRSLVTLFLLLFTIHIGNVIPGHEGREDGHNHFLLHFGNVFGKGVDTGADLARH